MGGRARGGGALISLTRCYRFPAAHVLRHPSLSEQENQRIFGKCANPNGHGHNYGVEVTVTGPVDPESGQLIPVELLDSIFEQTVREPLSHRMLNQLERFRGQVPTAEVIAVATMIASRTNPIASTSRLVQVRKCS